MSKRNSIILIFSIFFIIFGILLYYYFLNNTAPAPKKTNNITETEDIFGGSSGNKTLTVASTTLPIQKEIKKGLLVEVYRSPTAGSVIFANKGQENILRFTDRGNGNIYEFFPDSGANPIRISNTTIPKIQEAIWSNSGENVVLRYLNGDSDDIISFAAKLNLVTTSTSTEIGQTTGTLLPSNISQAVTSPAGDKILGMSLKNNFAGSFGVIYNFNSTNKKQVFDSDITDSKISWPSENFITLTTKASSKYFGYLYFYNISTNSTEKILGSILGLSTVTNKDMTKIAYSRSEGNFSYLDLYETKSKSSIFTDIPTIADKCVWGNKRSDILYCAVPKSKIEGSYPDDWYKGIISFSDNIWMIDTDSGQTKIIYQIGKKESANIDGIKLSLSPDDKYLSFINKRDLSLWLLNVDEASALGVEVGD